jgi:hypothetical protein
MNHYCPQRPRRYDHNPQKSARVPIMPKRDMPADILIKALVGSRTSSVYHVFEVRRRRPAAKTTPNPFPV